jgi:hypothetical protein
MTVQINMRITCITCDTHTLHYAHTLYAYTITLSSYTLHTILIHYTLYSYTGTAQVMCVGGDVKEDDDPMLAAQVVYGYSV